MPLTGTYVGNKACFLIQVFKGYCMSRCDVANMDIVPDSRPVYSVVIITKYLKIFVLSVGSKATPEQRERYSAARIKYMLENPDKLPRKLFNTVPELEFEAELSKKGIIFERSVHIGNRVFDFKIGSNVLIEIDGPYHRRIGMYIRMDASDDEKVEKLMHTIERDRGKDAMARKIGYLVYRIPVGQHLPTNWYEILLEQGFVEF